MTVTPDAGNRDKGLEFLCDDAALRITQQGSAAPLHVVSFTGIGNAQMDVQKEEFRRSLGHGPRLATTYVIDKQRGWFNETGERVTAHLRAATAGSESVVTLGNSMGGFGAFHFAPLIPRCRRAIAFVPQFSVHPRHFPAGDKRWAGYRRRIAEHRITHVFDRTSPDIDYIAFFSANDELDMRHARRINRAGTPRTWVYLIEGKAHGAANVVRDAGCLPQLLDMLIHEERFDATAVLTLLMRHGLEVRTMPRETVAA